MKITLDSTEPLEEAIRVIGALYGVTLVVFGAQEDAMRSVEEVASEPSTRRGKKRSSTAKKPRPAVAATTTEAAKPKPKPNSAQGANGAPSNAEVRSWARENGLAVSGRGRVSGSVMAAYRNAHIE